MERFRLVVVISLWWFSITSAITAFQKSSSRILVTIGNIYYKWPPIVWIHSTVLQQRCALKTIFIKPFIYTQNIVLYKYILKFLAKKNFRFHFLFFRLNINIFSFTLKNWFWLTTRYQPGWRCWKGKFSTTNI